MLFIALSQLQENPFSGLVTLVTFSVVLLAALTAHEFSHALAATRLGDPTPRYMGRLSLHPLAHLDPVGTTMIFLAGFGWAKPVPVNLSHLRTAERPGMAVVALAGPLANVVAAALFALPIRAGLVASTFVGFTLFVGQPDDLGGYVIGSAVFWNLLLAAFNLIPIAPLDGFKVVLGILPSEMAPAFARLERYGPVILLLLIMLAFLLPGPGILFRIVRPILNLLSLVVLGRQLM